jgi:hypothetical protein
MDWIYWANQVIIIGFVGTLTFIIWVTTFELTIYVIQHWDWFTFTNILNFLAEAATNPGALLINAYLSFTTIMKVLLFLAVFFIYLIMQLDAFLQSPYPRRARAIRLGQINPNAPSDSAEFRHEDILWMLRPPEGTPAWKIVGLRFASNIVRLEALMLGRDPPFVLCPKGGQAVIYAMHEGQFYSIAFTVVCNLLPLEIGMYISKLS